MSDSRSAIDTAGPPQAGPVSPLFAYELRREGRVVATVEGKKTVDGAVVETVVFPVDQSAGGQGVPRSFSFGSTEHARRFVDEALVTLEYLNCSLA